MTSRCTIDQERALLPKVRLTDFYAQRDREDRYEYQWGYVNPVASAYWRMRDALVCQAVATRFNTLRQPLRVLEIGSGYGHELVKFGALGICQSNLTGIDIVSERVHRARMLYPSMTFLEQDATCLEFAEDSFDIVCQFTCVMHGESLDMQRKICQEMVRVLRPGGLIIWWDLTPLRWRILLFRAVFNLLSTNRSRKCALLDMKNAMMELLLPSQRNKAAERRRDPHILPISLDDIRRFFAGFDIQANSVGLDYYIWEVLWPRHPTFAEWLWRKAWLSHHGFAIVQKA